MRITTKLTGTSPLVMHNPRLANPDDDFTRAIAAITGKRKKTEDDRTEIAKLEFAGGLYIDADGPYVPGHAVRRMVVEAGKSRRLGTAVGQAAIVVDFKVPLIHPGPSTVDGLYAIPENRYYTSVGVGTKRIMRMRPQFPYWSLEVEWELLVDRLDFDDFDQLIHYAGLANGLLDNRINGYGRFTAEVTK